MGKKNRRTADSTGVQSNAPRATPLRHLTKAGSKLQSPLSRLPLQHLDWDRDLLPEHLWIAALADSWGVPGLKQPTRPSLTP